ncbi:GumC family protein [Desulfobacula sp.]|uniref:GumC family protein n=1 Tax=Desulfobacula sp. TaxID=2593537 RepID=UPI0025BD9209|nr:GumC family protein [Desulfobacula sp.]MBC2704272.1 GumC family protein [Desulfobacula sp.]
MQDSPMEDPFQEKEIHLSEYFMVLSKRKTLIILVFILTVAATMFYSYTTDPIFQSSAKLIIDKEKTSSPITGERTDFESYHSQTMTFNTSIKMIRSKPVIQQVITALKLDAENNDQDLEVSFIKELISQFKANIKLLLKMDENEELSPDELENRKMQSLIAMVKEKIEVEQVRDTRLLDLSVKDKDPVLAADMVNMLAKKYMEFNLGNKMESSKQTLEWLNNELYDLRKKLEDDERKFFEYKQVNKVFSITGKQKLAEHKIQEFNNKYLETRNKRLELDAKINEIDKNIKGIKGVANVRSLINNKMIETIYSKIVDIEMELTRLSKIYKSKHPKIALAKSELAKSEKQLAQEILKETKNLKSERKVLYAKEKILEQNITGFEKDALDASTKELKYTILQRNVNTSQNLYDLMVSRVKESNILQTSNTSNIRLVEQAQVSASPVSPNKKRNLLLSIVLGLFFGAGLAFFFEYLDQTVRTEEDIHTHFNLPVLSVIPKADRSTTYGADY